MTSSATLRSCSGGLHRMSSIDRGARGAVFLSGVRGGADAVERARDDGTRSGEVRSRAEAGDSARPRTLDYAWSTPVANGEPLPHGIGWFVQTYNGEKVVWQFGMARERVFIADDHAAGARAHADPDGEQ